MVDMVQLEKPKAIVEDIVAKPSKVQKKYIKSLGHRAAMIRGGGIDPRLDNMLRITSDGRKIGLDQRIFDPNLPDYPGSKVNKCVDNVFSIYQETADKRGTQCIFCDLSTPKTESRQDCFRIYRPNANESIGYELIRKKVGLKKGEDDYSKIKAHISKNATEDEDKLKDGDICVIRRPNEDFTKILSEAAVFENGRFVVDMSGDLLEKLEMSPTEDMPPKEFNIYDDIKKKLVERGVPANEIAFIHDYDTAEQKQKLFNQMNAGEVRIMLGSTAKCGAGVNIQKKLIALHHLDCPLRPADVAQFKRNIIRVKNIGLEFTDKLVVNFDFLCFLPVDHFCRVNNYLVNENMQKCGVKLLDFRIAFYKLDKVIGVIVSDFYGAQHFLALGNNLFKLYLFGFVSGCKLSVIAFGDISRNFIFIQSSKKFIQL